MRPSHFQEGARLGQRGGEGDDKAALDDELAGGREQARARPWRSGRIASSDPPREVGVHLSLDPCNAPPAHGDWLRELRIFGELAIDRSARERRARADGTTGDKGRLLWHEHTSNSRRARQHTAPVPGSPTAVGVFELPGALLPCRASTGWTAVRQSVGTSEPAACCAGVRYSMCATMLGARHPPCRRHVSVIGADVSCRQYRFSSSGRFRQLNNVGSRLVEVLGPRRHELAALLKLNLNSYGLISASSGA